MSRCCHRLAWSRLHSCCHIVCVWLVILAIATNHRCRREFHVIQLAKNARMAEVDNNTGLNETISEQKDACRKNDKLLDTKHALRKRQSFKFSRSDRDIYVNNKTSFKVSHLTTITFRSLQFLHCRFETNTSVCYSIYLTLSVCKYFEGTIVQMRETIRQRRAWAGHPWSWCCCMQSCQLGSAIEGNSSWDFRSWY